MMTIDQADYRDRNVIRQVLEDRRLRLAEDIRVRVARLRDEGANTTPATDEDNSDASDLDLNVQMIEMATAMLRRIDSAIERLAVGQYGRCARCRKQIDEARLRAMPLAQFCLDCETAREREAMDVHCGRMRWRDFEPIAAGNDL